MSWYLLYNLLTSNNEAKFTHLYDDLWLNQISKLEITVIRLGVLLSDQLREVFNVSQYISQNFSFEFFPWQTLKYNGVYRFH